MAESSIEWTNYTFNGWIGCTKVHEGCAKCYAERDMDLRWGKVVWGPNGTRSRTTDANWNLPLVWNRDAKREGVRPRVFAFSLGDVFEQWDGPMLDHKGRQLFTIEGGDYFTEAEYPECRAAQMDDLRRDLFRLIEATPNLDWLILTKRPQEIYSMPPIPPDNVWLGTSISNQKTADKQIENLIKVRERARYLFLSCEPLLAPINLRPWLEIAIDKATGNWVRSGFKPEIDMVIAGGESGPKSRACEVGWLRDLMNQCAAAHVAFFNKQLGAKVIDNDATSATHFPAEMCWPEGTRFDSEDCHRVRLKHKKGGDIAEWPEDVRVRQLPFHMT